MDEDKLEDPGILQLLLSGNGKKTVPDKTIENDPQANEQETFTFNMNEARRLASHMAMARSRPSSSWTSSKGTPGKQGKLRMSGKRIEMAAR